MKSEVKIFILVKTVPKSQDGNFIRRYCSQCQLCQQSATEMFGLLLGYFEWDYLKKNWEFLIYYKLKLKRRVIWSAFAMQLLEFLLTEFV